MFLISVLTKRQPLLILPFVVVHLLGITGLESAFAAVRHGLFWRLAMLGTGAVVLVLAVFGAWPVRAFL